MAKTTNQDDIKYIEALAELLKTKDLAEIEVLRRYGENDALEVRVSRFSSNLAAPMMQAPLVQSPMMQAPTMTTASAQVSQAPQTSSGVSSPNLDNAVTSPMVGTAYLSPEPGAASFISVGDRVEIGQTLLIIEAMKTMNQIPATKAGVVKQILVDNASPVEYGDPLVIIE